MPHFLLIRRHLPVEHDAIQMDVEIGGIGREAGISAGTKAG